MRLGFLILISAAACLSASAQTGARNLVALEARWGRGQGYVSASAEGVHVHLTESVSANYGRSEIIMEAQQARDFVTRVRIVRDTTVRLEAGEEITLSESVQARGATLHVQRDARRGRSRYYVGCFWTADPRTQESAYIEVTRTQLASFLAALLRGADYTERALTR